MSRETLTLLTPNAVKLQDSSPSTSKHSITWKDAAHALARLPDHISAYARLSMQDDYFDINMFKSCYESALIMGACLDLCSNVSVDRYRNAVRVCLLDCIRNNRNDCPVCNGRGSAMIDGSYVTCEECNGSGKIKITDEYLAYAIGYCDGSEFRKRFKTKYLQLKQEIHSNWDYQIDRALRGVYA